MVNYKEEQQICYDNNMQIFFKKDSNQCGFKNGLILGQTTKKYKVAIIEVNFSLAKTFCLESLYNVIP